MSKVLTDLELSDIVKRIVTQRVMGERGRYIRFVEELATLITKYCGGDVITTSDDVDDGLGVRVHIWGNDAVPPDDGIYAMYDTDVSLRGDVVDPVEVGKAIMEGSW